MALCTPTLAHMREQRATYRIVTDGVGLFLLPYDCWLLPPYQHCQWIIFDELEHGGLPLVQRLVIQRGTPE